MHKIKAFKPQVMIPACSSVELSFNGRTIHGCPFSNEIGVCVLLNLDTYEVAQHCPLKDGVLITFTAKERG